jgi:hypothetical protein
VQRTLQPKIRTEKASKMRTTAVLKNAARTPLIKFLGKRTTPGKTKFTQFDVVRDEYTQDQKTNLASIE